MNTTVAVVISYQNLLTLLKLWKCHQCVIYYNIFCRTREVSLIIFYSTDIPRKLMHSLPDEGLRTKTRHSIKLICKWAENWTWIIIKLKGAPVAHRVKCLPPYTEVKARFLYQKYWVQRVGVWSESWKVVMKPTRSWFSFGSLYLTLKLFCALRDKVWNKFKIQNPKLKIHWSWRKRERQQITSCGVTVWHWSGEIRVM